jgi:chromosome segregation ATPase
LVKEQKEALQAAVASLREQVASDKTRIEFMETTIAAGGDNSKALTEEVKRLESARQLERDSREACERELAGVRREAEDLALNKKDLETRLEASRAEAGMMKSRAEDLERRLDETTKSGSAASVANAELKGELSTLQASYRALELSSGRLAKEAEEHEEEVARTRNALAEVERELQQGQARTRELEMF